MAMPKTCEKLSLPMDNEPSMVEIPDSHLWSVEDRPVEVHLPRNITMPLIDLENNEAEIVQQIEYACETFGFFQIINHGVPQKLLQCMESEGRRLFSLTMEQKLKAQRPPDGLSGYGVARIASFFSKQFWSESFTWVGSPLHHAQTLWPHDYKTFCEMKKEYEDEMNKLAVKLLKLISASLGLNKSWIELEELFGVLQMNHYPVCGEPQRTMGLGPHTDSSLLTILYQGGVDGLQFQIHHHDHPEWVVVPALPHGLDVNLGDLLQVISNGRYRSPLHRAMPNSKKSRISIAYFWGPANDACVEPAADLVNSGHPPLYKSFTWREYLMTKAVHFNNALQLFQIQT